MATKHKSTIKTVFSVTISLLFVGYIFLNRHIIFHTLASVKWQYLVLAFGGQILIQISNAGLLKVTLKPLNKTIGSLESFGLTIVASAVNFFTPVVGGASVRAVYLKRNKDLSYTNFLGVIYANYLIIFLVSFLFGFFGVVSIPGAMDSEVGKFVAAFFACGAAASVAFMILEHQITNMLRKLNVKNKFLKNFIQKITLIDEGWSLIRNDYKTMLSMTIWSITAMLSIMLIYWSAIHSINLPATIGVVAVYAALATVGLLFNITPGSIGIRETVYTAIYSITFINAQQVVSFSLIDRATQLIILGLGWLVFSRTVMNKFSKSKAE